MVGYHYCVSNHRWCLYLSVWHWLYQLYILQGIKEPLYFACINCTTNCWIHLWYKFSSILWNTGWPILITRLLKNSRVQPSYWTRAHKNPPDDDTAIENSLNRSSVPKLGNLSYFTWSCDQNQQVQVIWLPLVANGMYPSTPFQWCHDVIWHRRTQKSVVITISSCPKNILAIIYGCVLVQIEYVLEVIISKFSLEQNSGCSCKQAFNFHPLLWTSSGLRDNWKTAPYMGSKRFYEHAQNLWKLCGGVRLA